MKKYKVGDHVVSVKGAGWIPEGIRGIVVDIADDYNHKDSAPVEVIFDYEFPMTGDGRTWSDLKSIKLRPLTKLDKVLK